MPQNEFAEMMQANLLARKELDNLIILFDLIKRRNLHVNFPRGSILHRLGSIDQIEIEKLNKFSFDAKPVKPVCGHLIEPYINHDLAFSSLIAQLKSSSTSS